MTLDEKAKRRPGKEWLLRKAAPVVLADGQQWLIQRPTWWLCPRFKNAKVERVDREFGYRHDISDLVDALAGVEEPEVAVSIVATIAGRLLVEVYDLAESELDQLLAIRASDPDPLRWVREVTAVITFNESTIPATEAANV